MSFELNYLLANPKKVIGCFLDILSFVFLGIKLHFKNHKLFFAEDMLRILEIAQTAYDKEFSNYTHTNFSFLQIFGNPRSIKCFFSHHHLQILNLNLLLISFYSMHLCYLNNDTDLATKALLLAFNY